MARFWQPSLLREEDIDELVALSQLQPGKAGAFTPAYVYWLRNANPAGLGQVGVAKEKSTGKILGVKWFVPVRMQVGDEEVLGAHSLYVLVHPDYRGKGIFTGLVPFCSEETHQRGVEFSYGLPNTLSFPRFVHRLGWSHIGDAHLYIRPMKMERLIVRRFGQGIFQQSIAAASHIGWRVFLRSRPPAPEADGITITEIDTQHEALDDFWGRVRGKYPIMVCRDSRFLHWRYTQIPDREYLILAGWYRGLVVATIILRNVSVEGILNGMIVDFLVEPSPAGNLAGDALLRRAIQYFEHSDVDQAGCLTLPVAKERKLLVRQGFVRCPVKLLPRPLPVILQVNGNKPSRRGLHHFDSWFLTLGDFDAV